MYKSAARVSLVVAAAAVAATLSATAPALAAEQTGTRHAQVVQVAADWTYWGHFDNLNYCIATGLAGRQNGRWSGWKCTYPSEGYDLYVQY